MNLAPQRLIRAQQKLLPCLSPGVESARHLRSAEGPIRQRSTILTRKGNALRNALIDNLDAVFSQPIDVCLARPKVAALYRVIKQAVDAVAVILIILRCVDSALRCNRVSPSRRILKAKALHLVAKLTQR